MKKLPFLDLRDRAEFGDPTSQILLGFLLEHGLKMAPDKVAAKEMYQRAANQGVAEAQYALAFLIADKESERAVSWFQKSAEAGYAPAQFVLGYIYQDGELTDPIATLAERWIKAAADQEYVPALAHLANMYAEGISVEVNLEESFRYLEKAARKGDPASEFGLGKYLIQKGGKRNVIEGINWIYSSAKRSYPFANMFLAEIYGEGLHGKKQQDELHEYFLEMSSFQEKDFY